jgi:alpha-1,3-mannosyl-glycoprotein beta-1,2-N-acetylglucosaminyltransferase
VEDDLLFSPDFYQYFVSTSPVLDEDSSVLLISAWNDNGFKGLVADPFELRRTDYFPGLGWLLPRHDRIVFFILI